MNIDEALSVLTPEERTKLIRSLPVAIHKVGVSLSEIGLTLTQFVTENRSSIDKLLALRDRRNSH